MCDSVKIAANTTQIGIIMISKNIENNQCFKTKIGLKKGVVIASLNINGLLLHLDEIKVLLKEQGIRNIALNETKIDNNISDQALVIEGYRFVTLGRNLHGGGVAICCCDTLEFRKRDDIPISTLEIVCIEIKPPRAKPYLVISWYRLPSDNEETFGKLECVLRSLESEDKEFILLGDTNCDYRVILQESSVTNLPNNIKQLENICNSFGLKQLINKPTRETIGTSSIIDHISINIASNVIESGVLKLGPSDHYLVYAIRKFRGNIPCNHKIIKTHKLKNFNEELFLNDLAAIDWQRILICSQDINEVVQNWTFFSSGKTCTPRRA